MKVPVLDHGFVRLVESWGGGDHEHLVNSPDPYSRDRLTEKEHSAHQIHEHEAGIIEAARQSTQGSFRGWDKDAKLLRYLHTHKHSTPFEFAGMVIEVKAPIFVFREWHRHRTQSYNEMSARYAPIPNEHYIPSVDRLIGDGDDANKQAGAVKGAEKLDECAAEHFRTVLADLYGAAEGLYQQSLARGVPKELARCIMPVGRYSQMRASANLRNWLAFLTLRMAPDAQWEIQEYARAVGQIVAETFPQTWKLFNE